MWTRPRLQVALLLALMVSSAAARELRTGDGPALALDDATGRITGVRLDGRALPLSPAPGGLFVQEFRRADDLPTRELLALGFEDAEPTWTSAAMADWDAAEAFARRTEGDAAEGAGFLRIGEGTAGAGMATAETIAVVPGEVLTVSWSARAAATDGTFILCLRLFDADGRDLTAIAAPPHGWLHTPYSNAHYKVGFSVSEPNEWQRFSYEYEVPPDVTAARLSLRVYQGGGLVADIDDVRITSRPGGWGPERPVRGPLSGGDAPVQTAVVDGLRFAVEYAAHPDHLSARVSVASAEPATVRVERYGEPGAEAFVAVRNPTDEPVEATLRFAARWWGGGELRLERLVAGGELPGRTEGDQFVTSMPLEPRRTEVLRVSRR